MSETLVKVDGVSKKFCRSLKKSLWYGMQDLGREITGHGHGGKGELRPDEFWAVKDVSFELKRGECLGLIGHNGAGKTTLLKMLNGLIKPDMGYIQMRGKVGALIALGAGFNPVLTGRENIYVNAAVLGLTKKETDQKLPQIIEYSGIAEFIDAPVQAYSSGMAVRLGFAIAAHTEPDILLLDEVLAVGDMAFQAKCLNTLAEYKSRGVASILVTHNMHHISRYASSVLYQKMGRTVMHGEVDQCIELFNAEMDEKMQIDNPCDNLLSNKFGSGRIFFESFKFIDENGQDVTRVHAGKEISLVISYQCTEPIETEVLLEIFIIKNGVTLYQGTNISMRQRLFVNENEGTLAVRFPSLPINGGAVSFSFNLLDRSTLEVFDWRKGLKLQIVGNPSHHGSIIIPAHWVCQGASEK